MGKTHRTILCIALLMLILSPLISCAGMAQLVEAEGTYALKTYVLQNHSWNIGIGFDQPAQGNLPTPRVGYWRTDTVVLATPLNDTEGARFVNEHDVTVSAENGAAVHTGNITTIEIDAEKYLAE